MPKETTLKIKGKYQFKQEKARMDRKGITILDEGKLPKKEQRNGFTHFIKFENND